MCGDTSSSPTSPTTWRLQLIVTNRARNGIVVSADQLGAAEGQLDGRRRGCQCLALRTRNGHLNNVASQVKRSWLNSSY